MSCFLWAWAALNGFFQLSEKRAKGEFETVYRVWAHFGFPLASFDRNGQRGAILK